MENVRTKKAVDLLEGPLLPKILVFVLPLMVSNLLQTLYNAADMMVVSLSKEANAVGAIGTTGAFINMIVNIFIGFSAGATVVVARHIGARDDKAVSETVKTAIIVSVIFGFIAEILGLIFAEPVLRLLGNRGKLLELSVLYTRIYFLGVPFISLTNYCISILRAKGDTKTPLIVLSAAGILNVLLNLLFVLAFDMSVDGVSLATTISNAVSAIVLLIILMNQKDACRFTFHNLRINKHAFMNILHIGLPSGIQGALFSISNMLIQSSIIKVNNGYGFAGDAYQPVVDGNAAVGNLEGFIYTATNSVCQAAITFTSQHVGANKYKRIRRVMLDCAVVTFAISAIFITALTVFSKPLLSLYGITGGDYAKDIAMQTAMTRIRWMIMPYGLLALMEIGSGVMRGLGRAITSTLISLGGACIFRIVWILTVFENVGTLEAVYASYPISWILVAVMQFTFAIVIVQRAIKDRERNLE